MLMSRSSGASWMCGRSDGLSLFNTSSKCSNNLLFWAFNCFLFLIAVHASSLSQSLCFLFFLS